MTGVAAEGNSDNLKQQPRSAQQRSATLECESPLLRVLARLQTIPRTTYILRHQRYISNIKLRYDAHLPLIARDGDASTTTRRRGARWLIALPPAAASAAAAACTRVSSCLFTLEGVAQLCKHILCCEAMKKMRLCAKLTANFNV